MSLTTEQIEAALKTVTDKLGHIDSILSGKASLVWRCSHSGLMYPADYVSQWGRKYGIGLGKTPVSECLDTLYHNKPISPAQAKTPEQVMYPFGVSLASVDAFFVGSDVANSNLPVLHEDDKLYIKRVPILVGKQLAKRGSLLNQLTNSIS